MLPTQNTIGSYRPWFMILTWSTFLQIGVYHPTYWIEIYPVNSVINSSFEQTGQVKIKLRVSSVSSVFFFFFFFFFFRKWVTPNLRLKLTNLTTWVYSLTTG